MVVAREIVKGFVYGVSLKLDALKVDLNAKIAFFARHENVNSKPVISGA